jgi:hypothetical protein
MPEDYLNSLTAKISQGIPVVGERLYAELDRANIFRKIRLANALQYRLSQPQSILYRIRNGKAFAQSANQFKLGQLKGFDYASMVINDVIRSDLEKHLVGKTVYMPEHIKYALPSTEKQFVGYFPAGSCIEIPENMIVGVYWENVDEHRIDLDLSTLSHKLGKVGWDSSYRNYDRTVLFSGDMTDAKGGATELLYVQKQQKDALIMMLNYYNYNENIPVPFKIIVAQRRLETLEKNYMVDPNDVITMADSLMNQRQRVLGLLVTEPMGSRFYFVEANMGNTITASGRKYVEDSRNYLFNFHMNALYLNDVLAKSSIKFVDDPEKADIDLSPENLEKDTILNLMV